MSRWSLRLLAAVTFVAVQGCAASPRARTIAADIEAAAAEAPGFRVCCLFSDDLPPGAEALGMGGFLEARALRGHVYGGDLAEDSGLVYTRRGGFLDLGHVRDYADWTVHLFARLQEARATLAPIELPDHGGRAVLRLRRADLDDEALLTVAQRAAYQFSIWHELATWHGWRTFPLHCERASAFSPEDLYSNLLGVHVGADAIRAAVRGADVDHALAEALAARLGRLGLLSAAASRAMLWKVEGPSGWWRDGASGVLAVTRRYVDGGDLLAPWLVDPGEPMALAVPGPDLADAYSLEIAPDLDAMPSLDLRTVGPVVEPAMLPRLLEEARRQIRCALGPLADRPVVVRSVDLPTGGYLLVYRGSDGAWHARAVSVAEGRDRTFHAAATRDPATLEERLRRLGVDEQRRRAIVFASGES